MVKEVFDSFDANRSGTITLLKFLDYFKPSYNPQTDVLTERIVRSIFKCRESLKQLFFEIDVDGDGHLSLEVLMRVVVRMWVRLWLLRLGEGDKDKV